MTLKSKIISIFCLFLLLLGFLLSYNLRDKSPKYKILKVIEADEFYMDLNFNNISEPDEHFKLKHAIALSANKNYFTLKHAKNKAISINDYLKTGYIARKFALDNYLNKEVEIIGELEKYNPVNKYREVEILLDGENLSKFLLKSGLATLKTNVVEADYQKEENLTQIKKNADSLKDSDFLILNLKNNIVHKLDCEFAQKISNGKLIRNSQNKNYIPCKICLERQQYISSFNIDKNKQNYKTSLYKKFNNLEFFVSNPYLYKKPENSCREYICKRLVQEINNAKESIDLALYGFGGQSEIFNALKQAQNRKVKIRSVLDYSKNMFEIYPYSADFIREFNPTTDKTDILMHNKFIIFDNKKVFTGSFNISQTDMTGYSLNSGVLINSKELAQLYKQEFEQMYKGNFQNKKEKISSKALTLDNFKIKPYFLPKTNGFKEGIEPYIKNAKDEIYVSIFFLTDNDFINDLIEAKKRNVNVLILSDATGANNFKSAIERLRKAHIALKVENWGGKNHEKTILIDKKVLILGSANFSKSGFYKNDENFLIIENSELASIYRDYYLFLFNSVDNKYLKLYPRSEGFESINSCTDGIDNNHDGKIDKDDDGCK